MGDLTFSDGVRWRVLEDRRKRPERACGLPGVEAARGPEEAWLAVIGEAGSETKPGEEAATPWVTKFPEIFREPQGIPQTREVTYTIRLKEGARPYRKVPYRLSPNQKKALEIELGEFYEKEWIYPSTSEWATVPFMVPKKEGGWRVVIDYRDLNAITEIDAYPLPRIDELLQRLAVSKVFSKVDLKSGFHQIPVDPGSRQFTAFRTSTPIQGHTLFEWGVMPMGLATAPGTFQRWMNLALQGLETISVVYLDDVLIHSATPKQHEEDVEKVLQRFHDRRMRIKASKCEFGLTRVKFLGHVIEGGRIHVDEEKLTKLNEWEAPLKGIQAIRQFLGFASYYRAFIENFAMLSLPLTDLLRKQATWTWTEEATLAMSKIKQALLDACARYAWREEREDRVTTDASGRGIGAVFEQRIEGTGWAPVAFWSRKLSEAERRYSATDQEWLAVMEAVTKQWRHWLRGRRFVLRSDHGALKQLLTTKGEDFSNRQFRWFEELQDYQFEFQHIPGHRNTAADALSRAPDYVISALEIDRETQETACLQWKEVQEAARNDAGYQAKLRDTREGRASWWKEREGLLEDAAGRLLVPEDMRIRYLLILEAHETPFCGHLGVKRTLEKVRRNWEWQSIARDVQQVVGACDLCQRFQGSSKKMEAPLTTIVASWPWEVVTMDFLSGFVPSKPGGWQGCAVVCDRFTRVMHVVKCNTYPTAQEAAKLFIKLVIRQHGVLRKIITDRGTQFESELWHETMAMMGSRVALASTHHPQSNGLTERMNRTLIAMIRRVCAQQQSGWVEALPLLEFAYNNSLHSATGVTPFQADTGRSPVVPASLLVPAKYSSPNTQRYAQDLRQRLQDIHQLVKENGEKADRGVKETADKRRGQPEFKEGEEVLCRRFRLATREGEVRKQDFLYDGPFVIKRMIRPDVAELDGLPRGAPTSINVQFLRHYHRLAQAAELRSTPPPLVSQESGGQRKWEVEEILEKRKRGRGEEYLLRWRGYPRPTWVPKKDLTGCKELLQEFRERQRCRAAVARTTHERES